MTGLCTQAEQCGELSIVRNWLLIPKPVEAAQGCRNDYPKSWRSQFEGEHVQRRWRQHHQWFAPTSGGEDLIYARKLINEAKDGILFLFFTRGKLCRVPGDSDEDWTLLPEHYYPAPRRQFQL